MNEQLQKALTELLNKVTTSLEDLSGKLPELVNQLIGYNIVKEWIYIALLIVVFSLFTFLAVLAFYELRIYQKRKECDKSWDDDGPGFILFVLILFAVCTLFPLAFQVVELVKLYCFPMVWVLDYLKEAVK